MLIAKAIRTGRLAFNCANWDMVCLVTVMIAQKTWDDLHLKNSDFLAILWNFEDHDARYRSVDLQFLNSMEREFLQVIHYDVYVSRKAYTIAFMEVASTFSD